MTLISYNNNVNAELILEFDATNLGSEFKYRAIDSYIIILNNVNKGSTSIDIHNDESFNLIKRFKIPSKELYGLNFLHNLSKYIHTKIVNDYIILSCTYREHSVEPDVIFILDMEHDKYYRIHEIFSQGINNISWYTVINNKLYYNVNGIGVHTINFDGLNAKLVSSSDGDIFKRITDIKQSVCNGIILTRDHAKFNMDNGCITLHTIIMNLEGQELKLLDRNSLAKIALFGHDRICNYNTETKKYTIINIFEDNIPKSVVFLDKNGEKIKGHWRLHDISEDLFSITIWVNRLMTIPFSCDYTDMKHIMKFKISKINTAKSARN
jgi:hypothetical protein